MYRNSRTADDAADTTPALTPQGLIRLTHYPPPISLQPYFTTLFTLECDEHRITDTLPAAVGYLAIVLQGTGSLRFASGRIDPAYPETLLAPTNAAVGLEVDGPLRMVAAALSPLGWFALTGRDAARWADRADEAGSVLGNGVHELGDRLRAGWTNGSLNAEAMAQALAVQLAGQLQKLNPEHVRLARIVSDWLSTSLDPALADLQAQLDYSARQLQRLITRYFGCAPKQLMRKYRALRVAALLQAPGISDERIAQLLNLFYDQSHMIREIRHFTGRTPQRLVAGAESVLAAATALGNYTQIKPNIARMPDD